MSKNVFAHLQCANAKAQMIKAATVSDLGEISRARGLTQAGVTNITT